MHVSWLGKDFTDAQVVQAVQYQFGRLVPQLDETIIRAMLRYYRQYKLDGMSDAWILKEMRAKRVAIAGQTYMPPTGPGGTGYYLPNLSDNQISNFVTTMQRLSKGDMPYNPYEKPTWGEAFEMGVGKLLPKDIARKIKDGIESMTVGKVVLIVGGGILLYGFVSGMGRGVGSR